MNSDKLTKSAFSNSSTDNHQLKTKDRTVNEFNSTHRSSTSLSLDTDNFNSNYN